MPASPNAAGGAPREAAAPPSGGSSSAARETARRTRGIAVIADRKAVAALGADGPPFGIAAHTVCYPVALQSARRFIAVTTDWRSADLLALSITTVLALRDAADLIDVVRRSPRGGRTRVLVGGPAVEVQSEPVA